MVPTYVPKALLLAQIVCAVLMLSVTPTAHQGMLEHRFLELVFYVGLLLSALVWLVTPIFAIAIICTGSLDKRAIPVFILGLAIAAASYFIPEAHRSSFVWLDFRNQMLFLGVAIAYSGVTLTWLLAEEEAERRIAA